MLIVGEYLPPRLPLYIPLLLLAMLAAASAVFWFLIRQWTLHRRQLALQDWADANHFSLPRHASPAIPEILKFLGPNATALITLAGKSETLLQIQTPLSPDQPPARWNLLLRDLPTSWPMTGLRPTLHAHSVLDLLPLHQMPTMLHSQRFILYGQGPRAAKVLAQSSAKALLPPDIGLLLLGETLILDFSTRPFDPLELQRLLPLAQQILTHLPTP